MAYNGPGNIGELNSDQVDRWKENVSGIFDEGVDKAKNEAKPPSPRSWFFNPLKEGVQDTSFHDIKWNAFPKRLLDQFGSNTAAWREAESSRGKHEEYCEWEVVRDPATQTVKRVTFTTEVPEYYEFLYESNPELLLELYHSYVSPDVQLRHLESNGRYNRQNVWNMPELQGRRGVLMHMGYGPNTLRAAVILSAEATWPSVDSNGDLITDEQGLINCRDFGAPERHSDPHIGAQINALVRNKNEVSFAGPAGLYIDSVDLSGFETPEGVSATDLVRVVRGDSDHMMRVVFEAPNGSGFELGDAKIDGNSIRFGGQIADKLTIRIRGIARSVGETPPSINCRGTQARPINTSSLMGLTDTRHNRFESLMSNE